MTPVYDGALAQMGWMLAGKMEHARALTLGYLRMGPTLSEFLTLRGEWRNNDATRPFTLARARGGWCRGAVGAEQ